MGMDTSCSGLVVVADIQQVITEQTVVSGKVDVGRH